MEVLQKVLFPEGICFNKCVSDAGIVAIVESVVERAKHIETIVAVVPVQLLHEVGVLRLEVTGAHIEAEALALQYFGPNLHHGLHACVVFGIGIGNEFYAFDFLRFQLVEFRGIAHQPPIDVDERCALAEHLKGTVFLHDARHVGQHVLACAELAQYGILYVGLYALSGHLILWNMALHCYAFQSIVIHL